MAEIWRVGTYVSTFSLRRFKDLSSSKGGDTESLCSASTWRLGALHGESLVLNGWCLYSDLAK